jgi:hypothetical protein
MREKKGNIISIKVKVKVALGQAIKAQGGVKL